jgi:hypothetical protein
MKETTFIPTESISYKLLRHDTSKDIFYYEGGWWMCGATYRELEADRFNKEYGDKQVWLGEYKNMNNRVVCAPRPNKETKEIELDKFILPSF